MEPTPPFNVSKTVNEALCAALVRYAGLMALVVGQNALDGLALVREETIAHAAKAGLPKDQLDQLDKLFKKAARNAFDTVSKLSRG